MTALPSTGLEVDPRVGSGDRSSLSRVPTSPGGNLTHDEHNRAAKPMRGVPEGCPLGLSFFKMRSSAIAMRSHYPVTCPSRPEPATIPSGSRHGANARRLSIDRIMMLVQANNHHDSTSQANPNQYRKEVTHVHRHEPVPGQRR